MPGLNLLLEEKPGAPAPPSLAGMAHPSRCGCQGPSACLRGQVWQPTLACFLLVPGNRSDGQMGRGWWDAGQQVHGQDGLLPPATSQGQSHPCGAGLAVGSA